MTIHTTVGDFSELAPDGIVRWTPPCDCEVLGLTRMNKGKPTYRELHYAVNAGETVTLDWQWGQ